MKKQLLILSLFLIFIIPKAKCQAEKDTANYPYWIEMMQYDTVNFFSVQKAFNKFYAAHQDNEADIKEQMQGKEEDEGIELYKRWEYITSRRIKPDGTRMQPDQVIDEYNTYLSKKANSTTIKTAIPGAGMSPGSNPTGNWKSLGPLTNPTDRVYQVDGMGRINAIAFHPTAKGTIYIGAPDGGLWVTTDSGTTWSTKTDGLASLGVSAIVLNPLKPAIIYIGTGDRDNNDATGIGVWKSLNGGASWTKSSNNMGNAVVSKIIMNPKDTSNLLAATSAGIYRSTNSGGSWTKTSSSTGFYKDIVFKPHNPNVAYATAGGGFFRSTNNGVSWTQISSGLTSASRGVIGVTSADTNRVYFITTSTNTFAACYISTNGGTSFRTKSTSPNIMDYSDNGSGTGGQAWYDLCVAADTANAGTIYVGGINVFKSIDSGATWTVSAHWVGTGVPVIHADVHVFAINPLNNKLYTGDDGGIAFTANGGNTWQDISSGLEITEIYKLGQSQSRPDMMLIGCQDNGSAQFAKKNWYSILGGDGMVCAIDPTDTNYQFAEIYYGSIYRSTDAGQTFYTNIAGKGIGNITEAGAWVTPYMLSYANSKEMFAGFDNLWKCYNLKASTPSWTQLSSNLNSSNTALIQAIDQSPVDTNTFYMSRDDNTLFLSSNVNGSTPTWTNLTSNLPVSNSLVAAIRTHPKYSNVVYIIQNNDVYVSTNKGNSWTKITGSLPGVPKNVIAIDKNSYSALYLGTDAGVYYRDSTMTDWTPFYSGLPVEPRIMDLNIYYDPNNSSNNFINAGSYGRGAWQSQLFSPVNPVVSFKVNKDTQCLNNNSFVFSDSTKISSGLLSAWAWDFGDSKTSKLQSPTHSYASPGTYTVKLIVTSTLGTTGNMVKTVTIYPQATPAFTVNAANQCFADNKFIFTDQSTSGSGTLLWIWNFGDGSGKSATEDTTYSYSAPGIDTVKLTVTTNNGCPAIFSKVITVFPEPSISFTINNTGQCLTGNIFSFTNNSSISSGSIQTWNWKFGDGDSSSVKSPSYTYKIADTEKVILYATSIFGCTDTGSQKVVVYPQTTTAFNFNSAAQCLSGNAFVVSDKSTITVGKIASWIWDFGDSYDTTTENPVHSYASPGTYKVKVFITTDNGCFDTLAKLVTVYPQPKSAFSSNNVFECLNYNQYRFSDNSVASSGNVITGWKWNFGDSTFSTKENPAHSYKKSGSYTVSLIANDSNYCTDSSAKTITIYPQIKAAFKVNDSVQCFESNSFAFSDQSILPSTGINTWAWSFGDTHHTTTENTIHSYNSPGSYKVMLIVSNADGCKDTINKTMIVHPQILPVWSINQVTQCFAVNNYVVIDSSTTSSGSIVSRSWNFGDGSYSTSSTQNHTYKKAGIYPITLTVRSDQGCFDSLTQNAIVNPTPTPHISGDTSVCARSNWIYKVKNDTGTSFSWTVSAGNITSLSDSSDSIRVNWPVFNSGRVTILEANTSGCMDSDSIVVVVKPLPVAKFGSTTHNIVCAESALSFIDSSKSAVHYFWQFGDGDTSSVASASHAYASAGKFTAIQIVTSAVGCSDTAKRSITVNPLPVTHWSADSVPFAHITFIAKDSILSSTSYAWDFGDGSKATGRKIRHIFPSNKIYTIKLIVTGTNGCTNEFDSTINVTVSSIEPENNLEKTLNLNIYPNPFHSSTNIDYALTANSNIKIVLYDIDGREISIIADQKQEAGNYKFEIDAVKYGLNPGTYIVKVYVNNAFIAKNIVKL